MRLALNSGSGAQLQIMDRNGRTVYAQEVNPGAQEIQLSIAELNSLYYVHMQSANDRQVQRLIVQ